MLRCSSLAVLSLEWIPLVLFSASGACTLNTAGITDPGSESGSSEASRGGAGGDTPRIVTGMGGALDAGHSDGLGGTVGVSGAGGSIASGAGGAGGAGPVITGGGGTQTAAGGAGGDLIPGDGGRTGAGGAIGVGGAPGVGGATGVGGAMGVGGATGVGGAMGVGGATARGTGGSPVISTNGCADGTREAFTSVRNFPSIAGCAGGWSIPGVTTTASLNPACARAAGNSGAKPAGTGCTVADLCAAGWHVCLGANELDALGVSCSDANLPSGNGMNNRMMFATRQHGLNGTTCNADDSTGVNNVHGCGNFGLTEDPNCSPLNRQFSHTECDMAPPWFCDTPNNQNIEAQLVIKTGSAAGGVLCCR